MSNLFANLPVPTSNAAGAAVDVSTMGATKTIIVGGPFQGTVTIEYSNDDGAAVWAPVPNSSFVNQPGRVTIDLAVKWMRAVMDNYKGGSANADVGAPAFQAIFAAISATPVDISAMSSFKTVVSPAANIVEISEDGVSWSQAFAFSNPGGQSAVVVGRLARCLNGMVWMGAAPTGDPASDVPIPPFPEDAPVQHTIFARLEGSDEDGTGTEENPYRTFQRAIRDIPFIVPPGNIFVVDITGIGVETLPDNYELPSWVISRIQNDGITIYAKHKLASALTEAEATITAGVINTDPVTGQFSVADGTKTWTPGALKGLFVHGNEDPELAGVIHDNTATEIFLTSNEGGDFTFPFIIEECSAELQGQGVDVDFGGAITVNSPHNIKFFGVSIVPIDPSSSLGFVQQGGLIWFEGCNLVRPAIDTPTRMIPLELSNVVMPLIGGETYIKSSRIVDGGTDGDGPIWLFRSANYGLSIFRGSVLDNCTTVQVEETTSGDFNGTKLGGSLTMSNILIKNAVGDAIYWPGGTASIFQTRINDSVADVTPGNAFRGQGGLYAKLDQVVGTGNAGVGIRVLDGAQVEMTAATTVTGSADQEVGNLGPAAYPAAPFNINDIGVPGTNAGGATGTNARLFVNP